MSKIKVCILQNGLSRGGTDTFVINLCKGLNKDIYDITIINPGGGPEMYVRESDVLSLGVSIIHTSPLDSIVSKLKHFYRLFRILKKGRFDVFQANIDLFNGPNLFVAWLASVPVRCCHSHNGMQQQSVVQGMTLKIRAYQSVMKWMCWKFSNRRCGCSEVANDFLYSGRNWGNASYPTVINNGIDLVKYRTKISAIDKKRELGLYNKYNIITVGRIIPQKNPIFIADSISALLQKRADVDFVWLGGGLMENMCKDIFRKSGVSERVHFMGFRDDVDEILQCAELFYMPSLFEGLPLVLVEAQAVGVPCLVSSSITSQANCGLVNYKSLNNSIDDWCMVIEQMIDKKIVLKLDDNKIHKFSIDYMVKQMEQVFAR